MIHILKHIANEEASLWLTIKGTKKKRGGGRDMETM